MIRHSITIHRGCFGACSFCTISAHQGRQVAWRSRESVLREVRALSAMEDFRGHITDLGGPTANMYGMSGKNMEQCGACRRPSCIYPGLCRNLNSDLGPLTELYRQVRGVTGVKRVTIGSGIRYDMFFRKDGSMGSSEREYVTELMRYHVSGRLKVAPEHSSPRVLELMRKPPFEVFKRFLRIFNEINEEYGLREQLVPYFISNHPASTTGDMAELAHETGMMNFRLEQVQDFTPTPMTLSGVIYCTGRDPFTGRDVHVPRRKEEKRLQRLFFFWYKDENRREITGELRRLGRGDLIGKIFGRKK